MELRQLRYLREIVRLGNFARAAAVLGITQPALSKSMSALERELGVSLLDRGPGGVTVTPFGRIMVDQAARSCAEIDRAVEELRALGGGRGGLVRVGGSTTVLRLVLPRVLARIEGEAGIEIAVVEGLRDDVATQLRAGEVDVALSLTLEAALAEEFRVERMLRGEIALVARTGHPLAGRAGLGLADLAPYCWILPNRWEAERAELFQRFEIAGLPRPQVAVQTSSSVLMAALMAGRDHLSYLPSSLLRLDDVFGDLVALEVAPLMAAPEICLVTRRHGVTLPALRAFLSAARSVGAQMEAAMGAGGAAEPPAARRAG